MCHGPLTLERLSPTALPNGSPRGQLNQFRLDISRGLRNEGSVGLQQQESTSLAARAAMVAAMVAAQAAAAVMRSTQIGNMFAGAQFDCHSLAEQLGLSVDE
jgi:hypothetical protein